MRLISGARVLTRSDRALQVGVRDPLVLSDLSDDERRFLERLETVANVSPTDRVRNAAVIARLVAAGLMEQDAAGAAPPPLRAAINDGGPIGCGIGLVLAQAGWAVAIDDGGRAVAAPRGTYDNSSLAATRQAAAADTIRRTVPSADVCVGRVRSDFSVIVSHGAALIEAAVPLMALDVPHLYVTTDERGAQVGPLVIPGQGACGTCVGLARATVDPDWPLLSLQLAAGRTLPWCPPDVAAHAAALVAGALGWWRSACASEVKMAPDWLSSDSLSSDWLNTVWHIDRHQPPTATAAPPHAHCGCGAMGPVGDEIAARRARMPGASE